MPARLILLTAMIGLLAVLGWLGFRGARSSEPTLELHPLVAGVRAHEEAIDLEAPRAKNEVVPEREIIRAPEVVEASPSRHEPWAEIGVFDGVAEVEPPSEVLQPWRLDVLNAVTSQRIQGAVTIEDAANELLAVTAFLPVTLSGEWRMRKLLLTAEGFRSVVIVHKEPEPLKVCKLCPVRQLHLEILPPGSAQGSFDVSVRAERMKGWHFDVGSGPARTEVLMLGTQQELTLQVSPSGLLSSTHQLMEENIALKAVGNTVYALDLNDFESPGQGSLRVALRFQEKVYGADNWQAHFEAFGNEDHGRPLPPIAPIALGEWEKSGDGLEYSLDLGQAAASLYHFRLEPLGIERDFNVIPHELTEISIDAPHLATIEIGTRWADEHEFMPGGYVSTEITYEVFPPSSNSDVPKGRAELFKRSQNLYRVSALPGMILLFGVNANPAWRADPKAHRCKPGLQRVELDLHPGSTRSSAMQEPGKGK